MNQSAEEEHVDVGDAQKSVLLGAEAYSQTQNRCWEEEEAQRGGRTKSTTLTNVAPCSVRRRPGTGVRCWGLRRARGRGQPAGEYARVEEDVAGFADLSQKTNQPGE